MAVTDVALTDVEQRLRRILQALVDVPRAPVATSCAYSEVYVILVAVIIDIDLLVLVLRVKYSAHSLQRSRRASFERMLT